MSNQQVSCSCVVSRLQQLWQEHDDVRLVLPGHSCSKRTTLSAETLYVTNDEIDWLHVAMWWKYSMDS